MKTNRALIIEDDIISITILTRYLEKIGIDCLECSDITEALVVLPKYDPDIIFLDLNLQTHEDGIELLKLRTISPQMSAIPVIVISGSANVKTIAECLKNGANSYLIKPIQKVLLISALQKMGITVL